jgi:hypothetical protein
MAHFTLALPLLIDGLLTSPDMVVKGTIPWILQTIPHVTLQQVA